MPTKLYPGFNRDATSPRETVTNSSDSPAGRQSCSGYRWSNSLQGESYKQAAGNASPERAADCIATLPEILSRRAAAPDYPSASLPSSPVLGQYGKSASRFQSETQNTENFHQTKPKAKQKHDADAALIERYAAQAAARELVPWEAVAGCLRRRQKQRDTVDVIYLPKSKGACYGGLQTCGSVWMCPVCSAKITERRRVELTAALTRAKELGLRAVMTTYTLRHYAGDSLAWLLDGLMLARKKATGGRAAKLLREQFGVVGSVRALEVTWSKENGWHVHVHELSFVSEGVNLDGLEAGLRLQWDRGLRLAGMREVNEHGCDVRTADIDIAAYVQKFGHERGWNVEHELSKQPVKKGRKGHFTPSELLRSYAFDGDLAAGDKWREYAIVFKGSRQLYWSPGLRKILLPGVVELTDAELAKRVDAPGFVLVGLSLLDWKAVLWNNKRAEVLVIARRSGGDRAELDAFVAALEAAPVASTRLNRVTQMRRSEVVSQRLEKEQEAVEMGLTIGECAQERFLSSGSVAGVVSKRCGALLFRRRLPSVEKGGASREEVKQWQEQRGKAQTSGNGS